MVCPRCGQEGTLELKRVGGREYAYVTHWYRDSTGRLRKKRCYLGPLGSYEYVSRMHEREGLTLRGLVKDVGNVKLTPNPRALQYIRELARYVRVAAWQLKDEVPTTELEQTIGELEATIAKLKELLNTRTP